jgi:hypothetical protein
MNLADKRGIRSRLLGAAAVAVLVGAAVFAALAIAHNRVFPNSVTLTKAGPNSPGGAANIFRGRVLSGRANCKRQREVQVWRADVSPEVRLFTTRTGSAGLAPGSWRRKIPALPNGAKVYALIETKVLPPFTAAHDHTCPVDRSPVRTIPYP